MANDVSWKSLFFAWPAEMPRRGVLVTLFGEQIPFANFLTGEALLMLERTNPDALGARAVILPYEQIAALKITDVVKSKALREAGFDGPAAKP